MYCGLKGNYVFGNANCKFLTPPPQLHGTTASSEPGRPQCRGFTITIRHATLGTAPLDKRSARRKELYLTTHNTHKRHISMSSVGFEPATLASQRPQALDRAATGIGNAHLELLLHV